MGVLTWMDFAQFRDGLSGLGGDTGRPNYVRAAYQGRMGQELIKGFKWSQGTKKRRAARAAAAAAEQAWKMATSALEQRLRDANAATAHFKTDGVYTLKQRLYRAKDAASGSTAEDVLEAVTTAEGALADASSGVEVLTEGTKQVRAMIAAGDAATESLEQARKELQDATRGVRELVSGANALIARAASAASFDKARRQQAAQAEMRRLETESRQERMRLDASARSEALPPVPAAPKPPAPRASWASWLPSWIQS